MKVTDLRFFLLFFLTLSLLYKNKNKTMLLKKPSSVDDCSVKDGFDAKVSLLLTHSTPSSI